MKKGNKNDRNNTVIISAIDILEKRHCPTRDYIKKQKKTKSQ